MNEIKNEFNVGDIVMTVRNVYDEYGSGGELSRFEKGTVLSFYDCKSSDGSPTLEYKVDFGKGRIWELPEDVLASPWLKRSIYM